MVSKQELRDSENMALTPREDGRTRYVPQEQLYKLKGDFPSDIPRGHRTPNGLIWGRSLSDFYWINRHPSEDEHDEGEDNGDSAANKDGEDNPGGRAPDKESQIWSASMLRELGEISCDKNDAVVLEQEKPSLNIPWSVLEGAEPIAAVPSSHPVASEDCSDDIPQEKERLHNHVAGDAVQIQLENDNLVPTHNSDERPAPQIRKIDDHPIVTDKDAAHCNDQSILSTENAVSSIDHSITIDEHVTTMTNDLLETGTNTDTGISGESMKSPIVKVTEEIVHNASHDPSGPQTAAVSPLSDSHERDASILKDVPSTASTCLTAEELSPRNPTEAADLEIPPYYGTMPHNSPFCIADLIKLEELIPEERLPVVLKVHDPCRVTSGRGRNYDPTSDHVMTYKRVYPTPCNNGSDNGQEEPVVAELHIHQQNLFGTGNHSSVYRAPLTLPAPLTVRARSDVIDATGGRVVVAVKIDSGRDSSQRHLCNEGRIYNEMPRHLMEDWGGFNIVPPVRFPVPVGPVVPKFFGFYLAERTGIDEDEDETDWSTQRTSARNPSPILLMEACGAQVEPSTFTLDQRSECYSLLLRLNHEGFTQGSYYDRNILIQPGPLTVHPSQRTMRTPSFRIVDFGRGKSNNPDDDVDVADAESVLELDDCDWGY